MPSADPTPPASPTKLGYDSRIPEAGLNKSDRFSFRNQWKSMLLGTLRGLPGLVLIGSLLLLIPSLTYALVDPWFGGNSTADAVETALKAACWAAAALTLISILQRLRYRKRRRPSPPVTGQNQN